MRATFILLFTLLCTAAFPQIVVNEFQSSNVNTIFDEDGDASDWIELYNSDSVAINLQGWSISDDYTAPTGWQLPNISIDPGKFLVLMASGKNGWLGQYWHTDFKLSAAGEPIILFDANGALAQLIDPVEVAPGASMGSWPDGADHFEQFSVPTPGASNLNGTLLVDAVVGFSHPSGFYNQGFELTLSTAEDAEIRYTRDGSAPTASDPLYSAPIPIEALPRKSGGFLNLEIGVPNAPPEASIFQAPIVRAAAFADGAQIGPDVCLTYFVGEGLDAHYSLPILSLQTDSANLFASDSGIYVAGASSDGIPNYKQRGDAWERPANVQYLDAAHQPAWQHTLGVRIHGHGSRERSQKTLKLYARKEYGSTAIEYPIFEQRDHASYSRILLRSANADRKGSALKDEFVHGLIANMNLEMQHSAPVLVFVNGVYWGIQQLRERQDKYYLQYTNGAVPDSIDLLASDGELEDGNLNAWNAFVEFVEAADFSSDADYQRVQELMDIDNFIDYEIAQLYLGNDDWPHRNIRFWRERKPDAKWRWLFYDCDNCMENARYNQILEYSRDSLFNQLPQWSRLTLSRLLQNDSFREAFYHRFLYHMSTTFATDRMLAKIDSMERLYEPHMVEHIERWPIPISFQVWQERIEELRTYALLRPAIMLDQLLDNYGEPFALYPNPSSTFINIDVRAGSEQITTVRVFDLAGKLVQSLPIDYAESGVQLDVSGIRSGLYIARIHYGNMVFYEKFLVIHE